MATFYDQFFYINLFSPPPAGTRLTTEYLQVDDANNSGTIGEGGNDTINGRDIIRAYTNDTLTIRLADGSQVTYTGTSFYVSNTESYFSPISSNPASNPVLLQSGQYVSSTYSPSSLGAAGVSTSTFGAPCFTRGVMITTDQGERAVETLQVGDLVETLDHGLQPIRWIGHRYLGQSDLAVASNMLPILIEGGALGKDRPAQDLLVSPQHRVLVRSSVAQRMFDTDEVLVAAKQLTALPGISVQDECDGVEYFHIMFDQHEVVRANQAWTESLYPGPEALKSIGTAACEELYSLFPELRYNTLPAARPLIPGRRGRQLAARHAGNNKPIAERRVHA